MFSEWGSCHDKYVRRLVILGPHTGTLFHTKTMLFINDHQTEVTEHHSIFYECMGTQQQVDTAIGNTGQYFFLSSPSPYL